MKSVLRHLAIFLLAFAVGTLYAVLVGMISGALRGALISWPIMMAISWTLFGPLKLMRFVGFILILPVALIGFEFYYSARRPGTVADQYMALDRSHYVPGTRVNVKSPNQSDPDASGWKFDELFIGADGFRADPISTRGNPRRCQYALIGDSMIYGSGLVYHDTFGPVLTELGIQPCVFGVTGNSPADYLATLKYVSQRIAPGAFVAFYLYAYNDFVGVNKYFTRRARGLAGKFPTIADLTERFDRWRRATFTFAWFHAPRVKAALKPWQYAVDGVKQVKLRYAHDPQNFDPRRPLDDKQRLALKLFFDGVADSAKDRNWRIAMVIHPDHAEIYANLARSARTLVDLDPRRGAALAMCKATSFGCEDISGWIYQRMIAEGQNPYFTDDRHFSRFGTQIVAENFIALTKRYSVVAER
ncbi:MAG: hypothetical protein EXR70_08565 [Deltaproteobacteria bacterium]|nr:hypothetical protein [Deltaproteobacteria bacterium]